MRKLFALTLVALLLGVGIVALIQTEPGYVLMSYGNYTLETSLWVGLLVILAAIFVLYLLLRLLFRLIGGQRSFFNWLGSRKAEQAQRLSTQGVINYTEGNWDKARRQLERGAQNSDAPLLNYLLAARSADHLQDTDKVHEYLRAANDVDASAAVAVEVTLAEMKLRAGEYQQALAALEEARNNIGRHPYVLDLMQRAYLGLGDWDNLLRLLPDLKKYKTLPHEAYLQLETRVHRELLDANASSEDRLSSAFAQMPARLKQDPDMLATYVAKLTALGASESAEKVILRALKQQWEPQLVRQYGFVQGADSAKQLAQAERWLKGHPQDAQLLLCLGRLSAREKLWGKARDYYESSYRIDHGPEVCAELGRLLTELGEPKVAGAYFREGLLQREQNLPELPKPDRVVLQGELLTRS